MPPTSPRRPAGLAALAAVSILVLAACNAGTAPGAATAMPSMPGSSAAPGACPTAPAPASNLEGWGPPTAAPAFIPVLINSLVTCGDNRILFALLDDKNQSLASPDRAATIKLYDLGRDPGKPIATTDAEFVWAIEDVRGIYVAHANLPEAGSYGAEITTATSSESPTTVRITFDVQPSSPVIGVGDAAPSSKTPTASDVGGDLSKLSTDANPDPAFYQLSVDQALAEHKPFVLVFATPKFCASAQCGPTLDRIKPYAADYPSVAFINVEPYKLTYVDGSLQADLDASGQLQPVTTTNEWGLLSEPDVFVVDRDGIVTASFELIFSDSELTQALDAVQ